ncbi:MAG: tyrosine-protein phosphatase [Traorella sp.]
MKLYRNNNDNQNEYVFDPKCSQSYRIKSLDDEDYTISEGKMILHSSKIHPLFEVIMNDKKEIIGERLIEEVGILNFRDLGGYETMDGKQVKYGCFYRSSPIVFNDEKSRNCFNELNMKAILDFRSQVEVNQRADEKFDNVSYYHINAIHDDQFEGSLDVRELLANNKADLLKTYMERIYKLIPFHHNPAYKKMFDLMLEGNIPFVFHCSAGKDRTGFGAYLILRVLGVSDEVALEDYLLSNDYLFESSQKLIQSFGDEELAKDLFFVKREYLMYSMKAIYEKYGDFKNYLKEEYDVDDDKIKRLKEMYLYD